MAEKEEQKLNFRNYVYADVAAKMSKNEGDANYLSGAVDLLTKNLDFGVDGVDLYQGFVNEKTLGQFIKIYDNKHKEALSKATVAELISWYEPAMSGATDEQKALMTSALSKFGGENYGELNKKINTLAYKAKDPDDKEGAEKAKKELTEKYGAFLQVKELLEGYTFEALRTKAVEASKKPNFGGLEKMLSPQENKQAA